MGLLIVDASLREPAAKIIWRRNQEQAQKIR
jgi:hypothetical protein